MSVRVRFAPSPTGNVHIGNIRAAIFNWLFARHYGGQFLLRIEDTDKLRSTPEAIAGLLEVMQWLDLSYDQAALYQSSQEPAHRAAVQRLLATGAAYRWAKDDGPAAVLFRIPWDAEKVPGVSAVEVVDIEVDTETPVQLDASGISFALISRKGKAMPQVACLAGFRDLQVFAADGQLLFELNPAIEPILAGDQVVVLEQAARLRYLRREIRYHDLIKGTLAKPLDSMRDLVIARSDGSPVFHLANVCDDLTQNITHIIRGDDHVENTYRHIFLIAALGGNLPHYAHLPMIVNDAGKPYSKRDGDAFVGDFRDKGFLPEALFNYLALLGWSPGDDRELMSRAELIEAFSLERCNSAPARMDMNKLLNMNGYYMAELPLAEFVARARAALAASSFRDLITDQDYFAKVAALLQSRTKVLTDLELWEHFFTELPGEYDEKTCRKQLKNLQVRNALQLVVDRVDASIGDADAVEALIHAATDAVELDRGKLNQPLRLAVTGSKVGAGIYETIALLGPQRTAKRIRAALQRFAETPDPSSTQVNE